LRPPVTFLALLPAAGNQDQTCHLVRCLVASLAPRPIWALVIVTFGEPNATDL